MNDLRKEFSNYDWLGIGLTLVLMAIGWLMIFASEYHAESYTHLIDLDKNYGKQLIWITAAIVLAVGVQIVDSKFIHTISPLAFAAVLFLLFAVLFTPPVNGASSWFGIGSFRLQPSEFSKTATNLALAALLTRPQFRMQEFKYQMQAVGLILSPVILIALQPDAGSCLVYVAFFLVIFRAGFPPFIYILGLSMASLGISSLMVDDVSGLMLSLIFLANLVALRLWQKDERWLLAALALGAVLYFLYQAAYFWPLLLFFSASLISLSALAGLKKRGQWQAVGFNLGVLALSIGYSATVNYAIYKLLRPHQQERILVWLRPEKCDPLGALYNVEQSKFAIGSGGLWGKGFLEGERTKLDYVPEQSTDFIFCTMGEEWGFMGSFLLISLFTALLLRILYLAERQRSDFAKYYAYGVAFILFMHLFVNIGMTVGLVPVIGIPLPFISYGGSSLMSFGILLAILFKLDFERKSIFR